MLNGVSDDSVITTFVLQAVNNNSTTKKYLCSPILLASSFSMSIFLQGALRGTNPRYPLIIRSGLI